MGPIPLPARQSLARARDSTPCTAVCVVLVELKAPELGRAHAQWARSWASPWASPWAPLSVRRSRLGHGLRGSDETSLAGSAVGLLVDSAVVLLVDPESQPRWAGTSAGASDASSWPLIEDSKYSRRSELLGDWKSPEGSGSRFLASALA